MKILVINVSLRPQSPLRLFPIGLGYVATAIKNAGFSFDLLDIDVERYSPAYVESFLKSNRYDAVCMGCIVTGYKTIKEYAAIIKSAHPQTKIIVGNSVATSIPHILLTRTAVDYAVIGEGEQTVVELLHEISAKRPVDKVKGICFLNGGEVVTTEPRALIEDISIIPPIDFSIFNVDKYIEYSKVYPSDPLPIPREQVRGLPVNTARGCIANCGFCYHVFKGVPYRYRSAASLVAEMRAMIEKYSLNHIYLLDELTFFSKKQTLELVNAILDEKLHFYWSGTCRSNLFDREEDLEIMAKMKASGCQSMGYSLESADEGILHDMNKKVLVAHFSRQTKLFHKAGIPVSTSLVIGYPQETPQTIKKTFDCCLENRIYPSAGYLLPQPGSSIYDYARQHGFIKDEEEYLLLMGDRQDLRLNMTSMPDAQLQNCVLEGLKRCNEVLGVGLSEKELVKTLYYRLPKIEKNNA
ncbi:MAG: cobalamin-dependent protein [Candidatus Omnitrophica bacterium]|nr:cobalamin-dependent protein [Candidatus Omnitrophota bacterium]